MHEWISAARRGTVVNRGSLTDDKKLINPKLGGIISVPLDIIIRTGVKYPQTMYENKTITH